MSNKDLVYRAINSSETDRVPFYLMLRAEVEQEVEDELGVEDVNAAIGSSLEIINTGFSDSLMDKIAENEYRDRFGVYHSSAGVGDSASPIQNPLNEVDDLSKLQFPDPAEGKLFEGLSSLSSERFSLAVKYCGLFERAWFLRGMENLMMDFYRNPEFVKELLDRIMEYNLGIIDEILEYPVDGIMLGDDWGGMDNLLMGPEIWDQFIKPRARQLYRKVNESGLQLFVHSCGNIKELLPDLIEMGVDVINPVQVLAMNPLEIKQKYGDQVALFGGVSTQGVLPHGEPEEVKSAVRDAVNSLSQGGGFILAPDQELQMDVPMENILAFIETAKEFI